MTIWTRAPHAFPPCCGRGGLDTIVRDREVVPPIPHVFVHGVHSFQGDIRQSTGQDCSLHVPVSLSAGHGLPPCAGILVTTRARHKVPPPHVTEHALSGPKAVTAQSTAHFVVAHARHSMLEPHGRPPKSARLAIVRLRNCMPPLHEAVQSPHSDQGDIVQCTGQGPRRHGVACSSAGQTYPP